MVDGSVVVVDSAQPTVYIFDPSKPDLVRYLPEVFSIGREHDSVIEIASLACFAPSCTAKLSFFVGKTVMLHLIKGPV